MPARLVEADEQSVPGVLFYLVGAYVNASNLVSQPGTQIFELPEIFQKTYFVNDYQADLKMRLASDGKLSDSDDYDTFQLTLRLMVRNGSQRMAEITAIPSDLAVSSALTASFTAALEFNVQAEVWGTLLDIEPAFVSLFFESARSDVLAFRIARDQYADTDVVVLRGMLAGRQSTVVLSARFIVDMSKAPPDVDVNPDSVEILAKVMDGDGSKVDFDTVKFLLHYIANFRHWMGVLG